MTGDRTRWPACTAQLDSGEFCDEPSAPDAPFPICTKHAVLAMHFVRDAQTYRLPAVQEIEAERREQRRREREDEERCIVYYVRVGELIKIGTTRNGVRSRMENFPPDRQVLATEPGSYNRERLRHTQFGHLRASGEWFHAAPALWNHIAELRELHGAPEDEGYAA